MGQTAEQSTRRWTRPGSRLIEEAVKQLDRIGGDSNVAQLYKKYCCYLAKPHSSTCVTKCRNGDYGSSAWIYYWWCCYGGTRVACQECTTGSNCYQGTFKCSQASGGGPSC